jgi:hypothetical protein
MPTVLRQGPCRLHFYKGETTQEPPHVHVVRDRLVAKFWLVPVRLARASRFSSLELRRIERILRVNEQYLLERWHGV